MQVVGERSRISTAKHFVFGTKDFSDCFSSTAGDLLNRQIYTTATHYESGEFHYSAKLLRSKELVRCDIKVSVPDDNSIFFHITNISLLCSYGRIIIYKSTNTKNGNRRLTYCEMNHEHMPQTSVQISSHTAVATFIIKRFSPDVFILLHFLAVLPLAKLSPEVRGGKSSQAVSSGKTCCHSTTGLSYHVRH